SGPVIEAEAHFGGVLVAVDGDAMGVVGDRGQRTVGVTFETDCARFGGEGGQRATGVVGGGDAAFALDHPGDETSNVSLEVDRPGLVEIGDAFEVSVDIAPDQEAGAVGVLDAGDLPDGATTEPGHVTVGVGDRGEAAGGIPGVGHRRLTGDDVGETADAIVHEPGYDPCRVDGLTQQTAGVVGQAAGDAVDRHRFGEAVLEI